MALDFNDVNLDFFLKKKLIHANLIIPVIKVFELMNRKSRKIIVELQYDNYKKKSGILLHKSFCAAQELCIFFLGIPIWYLVYVS